MKITYHISCCNFIDGEINALHTNEFYDELVDRLQKEDVESIYRYKKHRKSLISIILVQNYY